MDNENKKEEKTNKKKEKKVNNEIEVEPTIDEALSLSQRRQRARSMRKNKNRMKIARQRSRKRKATPEKIEKRAKRQARDMVKDRLAGKRNYKDLTPSEKVNIDKRYEKLPKSRVERLTKRLLPKVRKKELERLQSKNESFERMFVEGAGKEGTDELVKNYVDATPGQNKTATQLRKEVEKEFRNKILSTKYEVIKEMSLKKVSMSEVAIETVKKFSKENDVDIQSAAAEVVKWFDESLGMTSRQLASAASK